MKEIGQVVEIAGSNCRVEFIRTSACESCGACMRFGEKCMTVTMSNALHAVVGDQVVVEMSAKSVIGAGLWAYIFPLCMLVIGAVAGKTVLPLIGVNGDIPTAICALAFVGLSFLILRWLNPYFAKRRGFLPLMVEILRT
jgi:sigma-E factor negative regulatory protein RseC